MKEPVELENHVRSLMLATGFSREVLLAQIGRSELIEKEKRPAFSHVARPLEENADGVDTETAAAEKQLLLLLAEKRIEPGTVTAEDFISPERRALAEKLIEGMTPGAILESMSDENARARAASMLQKDSGAGNDGQLRMAGDCLRVLHKKRIEAKIAALQKEIVTQSGDEKRKTLLKIQELTKERQTAGRKE